MVSSATRSGLPGRTSTAAQLSQGLSVRTGWHDLIGQGVQAN